MRSAAKIFYLSVFGFMSLAGAEKHDKPNLHGYDTCAIDHNAMVSDACVSYHTIDALNDQIYSLLQSITQETDFFSFYRLNLFNKVCPFWQDADSMCGNIACAVNTIDSEEDIPLTWRAEELSKLEGPKAGHPGRKQQHERPRDRPLQGMLGENVGESCVVEYDDECDERDYCVPEDEGASGKGDYVSLVDNPERFTGYAGAGANQVWDAIYRENCFVKPTPELEQSSFLPMGGLGGLQAVQDFRNVLEKELKRPELLPLDNECVEKRVFHRLISGMHASISTHLCWDYLNQTTGQWHPNLQCFKERLQDHPERISNLYFNYALVSRAVSKLAKHLQGYTYCMGDPAQDQETKEKVSLLTSTLAERPQIFDENVMFQDPSAIDLKEDFRNRFRNVSRLMDCVGCDKCRLWGKLQVNGYGTALKVLFEYDETKNGENPPLRRTELVALINTLGRISHSIAAVRSFDRAMEVSDGQVFAIPAGSSTVKKSPGGKQTRRLVKDGGSTFYYEGDDDDNYQYITQKRPWERTRKRSKDDTFFDDLKTEFGVVWDTFNFVLKSWINAPRTIQRPAGALSTPATTSSAMTSTPNTSTTPTAASNTTTSAPSLPSRPSALSTVANQNASNYSPYGASRFGTTPYSGMAGYGSYSSPYSRFGGMGSMYGGYGGYGGMGSMYGGMGGYGGMYGNGMGMPGDPNDPNSLTNSFSQSTQATFQMIESIVGAFGGFAQMLESTYMATHSSFFAMVSVAEQFGNLRNTLGSALGIFTLIRWFRTLIAKITGRPPPADATALTPAAFAAFMGGRSTLPDGSPAPPRPSRKPFLMFLVALFGLPYLMGKLIKSLARSQEAQRQKMMVGANGEPAQAALDPSKLDFCRVLYDYTPESQETNGIDLAVKKGDIVAVLSKSDPMGNASEWWRCRARDGRVGYLPGPYLETIQRKPQQAITSGSEAASRSSTMQSQSQAAGEAAVAAQKPEIKGKMGDISPESFQKSAFVS
ncbi:endoplasmic reticulum Oxidoreductin 1-domain-containing protein [Aspergillus filifer]